MTTSAIFRTAPQVLDTGTTSAIFKTAPAILKAGIASAIFRAPVSMLSVFGPASSSPYIEDYTSATSPLGPTSSSIYINPLQASIFGPTSSDAYQIIAGRGRGFRSAQFRQTTIALDRFAISPAAVLETFTDINLAATGTTTIFTTPANSNVIIMGCLIRIKSASNVTGDAEVSLGVNPSTTDLFAAETMVGVQGISDFWSFWKDESAGLIVSGGSGIDLDVITAATATTLTADAYIIGLLL